MKYTLYRISDQFHVRYKPVLRNGKPITFKTQKEGDKWLLLNPIKTTAKHPVTFEIRRTIKNNW